MANSTDRRGRLGDDPFDFSVTKAGLVSITRGGRIVMTLGGDAADRLRKKLAESDENGTQLVLAKATGNYRRGNERR